MRIELELLSSGNLPVDLGMVRPSKILSLSPGEIEKLTVLVAGCTNWVSISKFFTPRVVWMRWSCLGRRGGSFQPAVGWMQVGLQFMERPVRSQGRRCQEAS